MKILVTGATGFVGGAIAQKLKTTYDVSGLARSENSAQKIESMGLKVIRGSLDSIEETQLKDIDVVIHCAAYVEEWGTKSDFFRTNVVGTEKIISAAKSAGVSRFLFIGTEAAFFTGHDLWNINETIPYPNHLPYLYSQTKALAEQIVLDANSVQFQTLSLRPRFVWGPGDKSVLPTLIEMIHAKKFAWINHGDFQISSTYIDNLVHAVGQALTLGSGGNAFFIADEGTVNLREFLTAALAAHGVVAPGQSIPKPIIRTAAIFSEFLWRLLRIQSKPPLVRFTIDMMSANCTVNTDKAKKNLNYVPPVSREEGLARLALGR